MYYCSNRIYASIVALAARVRRPASRMLCSFRNRVILGLGTIRSWHDSAWYRRMATAIYLC